MGFEDMAVKRVWQRVMHITIPNQVQPLITQGRCPLGRWG